MDPASAKRRAARKSAANAPTEVKTAELKASVTEVAENVTEVTTDAVQDTVAKVETGVEAVKEAIAETTARAPEYNDTTSDAEADAELRLPEHATTPDATTPAAAETPVVEVTTTTETVEVKAPETTTEVASAEIAAAVAAAKEPYQSTMDGTDLAALLCARLCHDLVSPISAIGAALDVLQDPSAEDMHGQALELIRKSADQGWAKLEFTRLAFGAGGSAPGRIESGELRRVTEGMFNSEKLAIDWNVEAVDTEKGVARMLLNLCLLGAEALPRGGTVNITSDIDGTHFRIESNGRRARLAPDVEAALSGRTPEEGYDARSIQPFYTNELAKRAGGKTTARVEDEAVIFEAIFPEKV
jgi:histidine phosphotransferase ChpT